MFSVTSNPRLPRNNVGAGGCFCIRRIFWALFVRLDGVVPAALTDSETVPFSPSSDFFEGRPAKLFPANTWLSQAIGSCFKHIPSFMRRFRPSSCPSDSVIAVIFASGVAKSTYANLSVFRKIYAMLPTLLTPSFHPCQAAEEYLFA